jgi:RNA polymerase sigma-70 factor, ECF subfamily
MSDSSSVNHQQKLKQFDLMVLSHLHSAFGLARWYTHNEDDAKDLVQEAMLRAFKAFNTFRGTDGKVWLFTIIRHLYLTNVTRKRPQQTVFDEEIHLLGKPFPDPEAVLLQDLDSRLVRQGIEGLPDDFREVVILREMEGLSYKEIAEVTKVPVGTVMSRLARARDQLRHNLTGQTSKNALVGKNRQNSVAEGR